MTDDLIQRAQDALEGVRPESEITILESEWFCEIGYIDGGGIGRWEETAESHPFKTLAQAEALRDEWVATGKLYRTHWGELRPAGMDYGDFRIRKGSRILPAPPQLVPDLLARIAAQEAEIARLRNVADEAFRLGAAMMHEACRTAVPDTVEAMRLAAKSGMRKRPSIAGFIALEARERIDRLDPHHAETALAALTPEARHD